MDRQTDPTVNITTLHSRAIKIGTLPVASGVHRILSWTGSPRPEYRSIWARRAVALRGWDGTLLQYYSPGVSTQRTS